MYHWIPPWGEWVGRSHEDTLAELHRAWREGAPADAVYLDGRGIWMTITDLGGPRRAARAAADTPPADQAASSSDTGCGNPS